jgi:class 3 adenylate cyclase
VARSRQTKTRATSPATNSRRALDRLLSERNEHPERLAEIDRRIRDRFGETHAVLVLDMCGFSRLTVRYGITHFLAMIHRLHGMVAPIVAGTGGRVVKTEADNVFAVFPDVAPALEAARAIQRRLAAANVFLPKDWDLHASIGIGYGELLMVGGDDLFGSEMNLASKLGEDVAASGETFLTTAAYDRIEHSAPPHALDGYEAREIAISSMTVKAYKVR